MKILILGLGGIGQRHARNLRSILQDRVELLAYRVRGLTHMISPTLEADAGRNVEKELGIHVLPDLEAALAQRPDAAFICNPTSLHVETALACVAAGCDLFIEKPLSDRLDGVDQLIEAVEQAKRIAMVGYQLRFHPCLRTLASVIDSGALGAILAVRSTIGEYLPGFHPYEDYRESYAARADLGGGVVLTQIHEFDYLYSLFGPVRSVYALGGHWSHLDLDVEDVASTLMQATIGNRPLPIHLQQDYLQRPAVRQCEVTGDRGKAILDLRALSVTVVSPEGPPLVHSFADFDRNVMFIEEVRHFLACVEARTKPIVDLRDGRQSLEMAVAVKRSIASGTVVALHQDVPVSIPGRRS
jgi:predicted dehydrogenase